MCSEQCANIYQNLNAPRCSKRKLKLPVEQECHGELVMFVSYRVAGWVSGLSVGVGEEKEAIGMTRMENSVQLVEERLHPQQKEQTKLNQNYLLTPF